MWSNTTPDALRRMNPDLEIVEDALRDKTDAQTTISFMARQDLENAFETRWLQLGGPNLLREYVVGGSPKKWRFDFALPERRLLIEIDGGQWQEKGHGYGMKMEDDFEKQNWATIEGWVIVRYCTTMIHGPCAYEFIKIAIDYAKKEAGSD